MEDQVFIANGIAYRKVPPGVYEIPLSALGDLSMGHLLPHSSVHIADLPPPPPDHEFYLSITNGGDTNDNQYLDIFACVSFGSDEQRQAKMSRIRRAYLPLVERSELPEAFITPSTKDRPNKAAAFSIDLADRPTAIIREEIQPILQLFRRLSVPDRRVFICHATEDKPSARRIAAYMRQAGAEVWLDEWEIKVGDSIVEKVNAGLSGATHMLLLLSATSCKSAGSGASSPRRSCGSFQAILFACCRFSSSPAKCPQFFRTFGTQTFEITMKPRTSRFHTPSFRLRRTMLAANHALQPTPWIAVAFPSPLVRRG